MKKSIIVLVILSFIFMESCMFVDQSYSWRFINQTKNYYPTVKVFFDGEEVRLVGRLYPNQNCGYSLFEKKVPKKVKIEWEDEKGNKYSREFEVKKSIPKGWKTKDGIIKISIYNSNDAVLSFDSYSED